jgi:DNA-binding transcriptional regulator YiaG
MASKKSVVTAADEVTSVEAVDVGMDSSVAEADSEVMDTVDEVGVVEEEVLVEDAAQMSPKRLANIRENTGLSTLALAFCDLQSSHM